MNDENGDTGRGVDEDPVAAVEFLARSHTRVRMLSMLARERQLSKDELHDRVDASRTTIQRNLSALEERGWISSSNREYAITTAGRWIAEDFSNLVETVDKSIELGSILESVDTTRFDFDPRRVDFDITTPEPSNPTKMLQEHERSIEQADDIRAILPETGIHAMKQGYERVTDQGVPFTAVVSDDVLDVFQSNPEFRSYFEDKAFAEQGGISVTDAEIPFYLGILDDEVQIGISENGRPRALLQTESQKVFEWAQRTFSKYEADARPIDEV